MDTNSQRKTQGITPAQIRMIHAAKRTLGLDEETYRDMLYNVAGVTSSTELDQQGVNKLIRHMQSCGFRRTCQEPGRERSNSPVPRKGEKVIRLASAEELEKINVLRGLITWRVKDGYTLWLGKRMRITRVRTAQDAWRVIEGLKKMFEHQMEAEFGDAWWLLPHTDPEIIRYIDEHLSQRLSNGTLRREHADRL